MLNDKDKRLDDDFFGTPLGTALTMQMNLEEGDIISGRILKIDNEFVYVSTGFKSEGRIPLAEFNPGPDGDIGYKLDDEIEVMVERVAREDIYLSYISVVEKRRWAELSQAFEVHDAIDGTIEQSVKGGYRVNVGVERMAFLPGSQIGYPVANPADLVGKVLKFHIIEFNQETENIVVSHKEIMKKEAEEREGEVYGKLTIDDIVDGKVIKLTNFGAFVDVGGVEGLVHISELAWSRVGHPSQVLKCGDDVKVKILDINTETKKISLSIKQATGDPWGRVDEIFKPDEVIAGSVTKLMKYGVFVRISPEFEGLLHISEMQAAGEKKLTPGDDIQVRVIEVDKENRRIRLGLIPDPNAVPSTEASPKSDTSDGGEAGESFDQYMDNKRGTGITLGDALGDALKTDE